MMTNLINILYVLAKRCAGLENDDDYNDDDDDDDDGGDKEDIDDDEDDNGGGCDWAGQCCGLIFLFSLRAAGLRPVRRPNTVISSRFPAHSSSSGS